jgi:hypothetical protein
MSKKRKKIWIIIISIFLFLVMLVSCIAWYFLNDIGNKANAFLVKKVNESSKGLYNLEVGDIRIKLLEKKLLLKDVKINYDEKVLDSLKNQSLEPDLLYNLNIKEVAIEVTDIMNALRHGIYDIHYLVVEEPDLYILRDERQKQEKDTAKTINSLLPSFIHELDFDNISVNKCRFNYSFFEGNDTVQYIIENCSLDIKNLKLDSTTGINKQLPVYDEFILNLGKFDYELLNYIISFANISVNLVDSSIHVDTINVIPNYSKEDFAYIVKNPARVELGCYDIDIKNLNIKELAYNNLLMADSVNIYNVVANSYKNKNIPPTSEVKPLFHHIIQRLPVKINVPLVNVGNGYVRHEELGVGRTRAGYIEFSNMSAKIKDLTNIISEPKQYFTFEGKGQFMKTGKVNISLRLPVDPKNELFTIQGHLSGMDMTEVNTIVEPAANISVYSGKLNDLYFNMNGNNTRATLDMIMLYEDFSIALLTNDSYRKRWILSELANDLVLENQNPDIFGKERKVRVSVNRNLHLAHFNYLWIAVFEGIKESRGYTKKRQEMIKNFQSKDDKKKIDQQAVHDAINNFNSKSEERLKNKEESQKRKDLRKENINKIKKAGKNKK